jgi:hypothetical protein
MYARPLARLPGAGAGAGGCRGRVAAGRYATVAVLAGVLACRGASARPGHAASGAERGVVPDGPAGVRGRTPKESPATRRPPARVPSSPTRTAAPIPSTSPAVISARRPRSTTSCRSTAARRRLRSQAPTGPASAFRHSRSPPGRPGAIRYTSSSSGARGAAPRPPAGLSGRSARFRLVYEVSRQRGATGDLAGRGSGPRSRSTRRTCSTCGSRRRSSALRHNVASQLTWAAEQPRCARHG